MKNKNYKWQMFFTTDLYEKLGKTEELLVCLQHVHNVSDRANQSKLNQHPSYDL